MASINRCSTFCRSSVMERKVQFVAKMGTASGSGSGVGPMSYLHLPRMEILAVRLVDLLFGQQTAGSKDNSDYRHRRVTGAKDIPHSYEAPRRQNSSYS